MEKQKTKQRILDAALELFSTQGFEATSIAQIADAVGVRKASLYSHFDSKQDILDRLIESIMEDYAKHSVRSTADRIGDELDPDGVVRLVTEQIRYIVHDEHVSRARKMLTIEQYRNPQLAELKTKQSYTDVLAFAEALMERLVSEGKLKPLDTQMITGGGPGAMEATHLGAWMAGRSDQELQEAHSIMKVAERYTDKGWLETAWEVRRRYPQKDYNSLGVPTWLYGHEPSTPLATMIAKYFDNSIREDGILTIASGGIIYTPGSAGTLQEIFQEAVQNHYLTFGYASPMIFMGRDFWSHEVPVWPLMTYLVEHGKYQNLILCLTDSEREITEVLSAASAMLWRRITT